MPKEELLYPSDTWISFPATGVQLTARLPSACLGWPRCLGDGLQVEWGTCPPLATPVVNVDDVTVSKSSPWVETKTLCDPNFALGSFSHATTVGHNFIMLQGELIRSCKLLDVNRKCAQNRHIMPKHAAACGLFFSRFQGTKSKHTVCCINIGTSFTRLFFFFLLNCWLVHGQILHRASVLEFSLWGMFVCHYACRHYVPSFIQNNWVDVVSPETTQNMSIPFQKWDHLSWLSYETVPCSTAAE